MRHKLASETLQRKPFGSNIVFLVEGAIIKAFCNLWTEDFVAERAVLLSVSEMSVPRILGEGQIDNWHYLVLSVVGGTPIGEIWDGLQVEKKSDLLGQLGGLIRTLHRQKPAAGLRNEWSAFIRQRVEGAAAHHAAEEPWKSWIRERLERAHARGWGWGIATR